MSLSRTQIVNWLTRCGDIFSTESEYLTGLDREIGDADHGLNMNRGFSPWSGDAFGGLSGRNFHLTDAR